MHVTLNRDVVYRNVDPVKAVKLVKFRIRAIWLVRPNNVNKRVDWLVIKSATVEDPWLRTKRLLKQGQTWKNLLLLNVHGKRTIKSIQIYIIAKKELVTICLNEGRVTILEGLKDSPCLHNSGWPSYQGNFNGKVTLPLRRLYSCLVSQMQFSLFLNSLIAQDGLILRQYSSFIT